MLRDTLAQSLAKHWKQVCSTSHNMSWPQPGSHANQLITSRPEGQNQNKAIERSSKAATHQQQSKTAQYPITLW